MAAKTLKGIPEEEKENEQNEGLCKCSKRSV